MKRMKFPQHPKLPGPLIFGLHRAPYAGPASTRLDGATVKIMAVERPKGFDHLFVVYARMEEKLIESGKALSIFKQRRAINGIRRELRESLGVKGSLIVGTDSEFRQFLLDAGIPESPDPTLGQ